MNEQQPWEQMPGETALWFGRFERYRLMWPHSINRVYQEEWRAERLHKLRGDEKGQKETGIDVTLEQELPKEAPGKWREMAQKYQWVDRAASWDAFVTADIEQKVAAEKQHTLLTGYAMMYRRVAQLNDQAEQLIAMLGDPNKVWVPDVKAIGNGPNAERVDLVQFNAALFHEIRATFDDIAAELGERVKKKDITVRELPPDQYEGITEADEGSEE